MLLQSTIITLFASFTLTAAFPGSYNTKDSYTPHEETTCSAVYYTKTSSGSKPTTYLITKTEVVPVTSIGGVPTTIVSPCLYTSTGYVTKTITSLATELRTKTIPVTTYTVHVESDVKTNTKIETSQTVSVGTSYKTSVGTVPTTYVSSKTNDVVKTETKDVPFDSTIVETKTVCETKGGYGEGYHTTNGYGEGYKTKERDGERYTTKY